MKKVLRFSLTVFLLLVLLMGGLFGQIYSEGRNSTDRTPETILVFGAMIKDRELSETLRLRCDTALDYLLTHPKSKAILLGGTGKGESISEASAMKDYFLRAGIEENRLYLEEQSSSTWTNLQQAKKILVEEKLSTPVLTCSSDYHQFRIKMLAKRLALEVYPLVAPTPKKAVVFSYFREIFALMKSLLMDF